MYTIKQAAARTGLSVPTIRVWERRYGVVQPDRTADGYRLYDDHAMARLATMRRLVEIDGMRPRQAAERVIALGPDLVLARQGPVGQTLDGMGAANASTSPSTVAVDSFVAAAHRLDVPAMERTLDEAFAIHPFESAMDQIVFPALRAVGDAWSAGSIDVASEHAASETVRRRLGQFFGAAGRNRTAAQIVVGLPPGARHEIGAFGFATAVRRAGVGVLYLGADVPMESWLVAVQVTDARIVVLGVVVPSDVGPALTVVRALEAMPRPATCLLGGPRAHDVRGVLRLPDPIKDAVAVVIDLIADHQRRTD